ncbi:hypothetical protein E2C01_054856 [Portunus trituberculatus]|uniref:Uncharacterized protein n=1 Tax=Portunus trituberculatus TaxID=210409 RepID=A0A5B7GT21_PORTR|nr:hypothetical protein [Portunus trituberculatus]
MLPFLRRWQRGAHRSKPLRPSSSSNPGGLESSYSSSSSSSSFFFFDSEAFSRSLVSTLLVTRESNLQFHLKVTSAQQRHPTVHET